MTKKQFHEEMGKLDIQYLHSIYNNIKQIIEYLPPEVSRAMQLTKFNLLLEDLIDKRNKKGGE